MLVNGEGLLLDNDTYFSPEASMRFMGASQFKSFMDCPARTMAELRGEYERPDTKALLMGSYVDAYFSDEMGQFLQQHPEVFKRNSTDLKAEYQQCDKMIARASEHPLFMEFMGGEHQRIMTGELFGVPYKIKMDSYHPGKMIVDLKCMRDTKPVYKDGRMQTFIDAWQYDLQLYIYQQIEAQNSEDGLLLPCYLAVITKEEEPDIRLIEVPQWKLNGCESLIAHYSPIFQSYKDGTAEPLRCDKCAYCRRTKKLERVESYEELMEELV